MRLTDMNSGDIHVRIKRGRDHYIHFNDGAVFIQADDVISLDKAISLLERAKFDLLNGEVLQDLIDDE